MSSEADVKRLLEQITKLCGKISVAKKETSQLAELCNILSNRLSDRPSNYDDIKSKLPKVEEQLKSWSKLNYPKSLMKKGHIEASVTGFIEELQVKDTRDNNNASTGNEAPRLRQLDGEVEIGERTYARGPYGEIFVGKWTSGPGEVEDVALKTTKALRMPSPSEGVNKKPERELLRWADLKHTNVLKFHGIVTKSYPEHPYMVLPLYKNGNLLEYVKKTSQPDKNRLLCGSASGLSYLHSREIIHGSVKCKNVLVSDEGEPQIWNFEIARIADETSENAAARTVSSGDNVRYAAPELIRINGAPATKHSDTYSFALLVLECITEEQPFPHLDRDAAVIHVRITKGQSPPRPDRQDQKKHISDRLWKCMEDCWNPAPDRRPSMEFVQKFLIDNKD